MLQELPEKEVVDLFEKRLGSDATTERTILTLKREDATIGQRMMEVTDRIHRLLHWTSCYDDDCLTHRSDKEGANWYPQEPRKPKKQSKEQGKEHTFW